MLECRACPDGGMVYAQHLKCCLARDVGSTPTLGTATSPSGKARDCKSLIRRFDSARGLNLLPQQFVDTLAVLLALIDEELKLGYKL